MNWREERDREKAERDAARRAAREARQAEERRQIAAHKAEMFAGYELPPVVLEAAYAKAWEDGHSGGFSEVAYCFSDLAELALTAYTQGALHAKEAQG